MESMLNHSHLFSLLLVFVVLHFLLQSTEGEIISLRLSCWHCLHLFCAQTAVGQNCIPHMACPGKWKHGAQNPWASSWWFHFDPYPNSFEIFRLTASSPAICDCSSPPGRASSMRIGHVPARGDSHLTLKTQPHHTCCYCNEIISIPFIPSYDLNGYG